MLASLVDELQRYCTVRMEFPESSTNTCTVTVEADEYSATVETETLLTNDERWLRLEFYLRAGRSTGSIRRSSTVSTRPNHRDRVDSRRPGFPAGLFYSAQSRTELSRTRAALLGPSVLVIALAPGSHQL